MRLAELRLSLAGFPQRESPPTVGLQKTLIDRNFANGRKISAQTTPITPEGSANLPPILIPSVENCAENVSLARQNSEYLL